MKVQSIITDYIDFHANRRPHAKFIGDECQSLTFREASDKVEKIAGALIQLGLTKGDRIAIIGKNSADHLLAFLACARTGIVPTGLNYRLAPSEWSFIIKDAGAKIVLADAEFYALLDADSRALPCYLLAGEHDGKATFDEWIEQTSRPFVTPNILPDDILFQMYTSGTTGLPKGALLTHSNVVTNSFQAPTTNGHFPTINDKYLTIAPLYHAAGLIGTLVAAIFGVEILIQRDYDPVGFIETLANEKITGTTVIPVMLQFSIACVPNIRDFDFSHLDAISYGASPIAEELLRESIDIFGCEFAQGYGQTEATAGLTMLSREDHLAAINGKPELLGSCGRPLIGTEMKIVNNEGQEVPRGEPGEIIARGPQVMQGYWNRPEATAKTIVNGWLHTGDIGRMDEEGYVYILDRAKDMIISGGENVYPVEVEKTLISHEAIDDVAVIGVPDERWGEVPLAVIVSSNRSALSVTVIDEYCRGKLAGYKIPKHIECVDMLPRNPTGKILKKDLREQFVGRYELSVEEA